MEVTHDKQSKHINGLSIPAGTTKMKNYQTKR
jgi:hypothetical protein